MKKVIAVAVFFLFSLGVTSVQAITFVNLYGTITGEVAELIPTVEGGLLVEIKNEHGLSRLNLPFGTYVLGDDIEVGDTITAYHNMIALDSFEGEVLALSPSIAGRYIATIDYTGRWIGRDTGTREFHVDFTRNFRQRFFVGDVIKAYYSPWGAYDIFDMPQYTAVFVVNGDFDYYLGALHEGRLSNSTRGGQGEGRELNLSDDTEILSNLGDPFEHDLAEGMHIAMVYEDSGTTKAIVLMWPLTVEMVWPEPPMMPNWPLLSDIRIDLQPRLGREYFFDIHVVTDPVSDWAKEQVRAAVALNLVPAALLSDFTEPITRAEFASLAVNLYEKRMGEIRGGLSFIDTDDAYVEKAAYIGIVSGVGGGNFKPNGTLTREQAAVMLRRLAEVLGRPLPGGDLDFVDTGYISSWALDGVKATVSAGIMSGVGDGQFAPQEQYTREQSIFTIMQLYGLLY